MRIILQVSTWIQLRVKLKMTTWNQQKFFSEPDHFLSNKKKKNSTHTHTHRVLNSTDLAVTAMMYPANSLKSLKDIEYILHDNINEGIILKSIEEVHYIFMPS